MSEFTVGQEVVLHSGSYRTSDPGTITKVGRTLVTIQGKYGREVKYRMDDQTINDTYGNGYFRTLEQEQEHQQLGQDVATLHDHGFRLDYPRPENDILHAVAEFLRSLDTTQQTG